MLHKKTIRDVDLTGKTVLLRADYNVPIKDGIIQDDYRIQKSLATLHYLLDHKCRIVICSHLGRPKNKDDLQFSLKPVADRLHELLKKEVTFAPDCLDDQTDGDIVLLENLRFYAQEEANDEAFAKQLAKNKDLFVQDGFGVVHRAHASTSAITKFVPSVAGFLVESEYSAIMEVIEAPDRPLFALIGGAKISDKIGMLHRFVDVADVVAVGGAMANTFLLAQGISIGQSLADPADVPLAKEIIAKARKKAASSNFVFYLPQDGVVAKEIDSASKTRIVDWGTHAIAEIESYPQFPKPEHSVVAPNEKILDIGPFSGAFIAGAMQLAHTVVWNGAMGVTEVAALQSKTGPFSHGTALVVESMLGQFGHKPRTIVGGGDTVGYVEKQQLVEHFAHVSTGGGASMDLMSGKQLPGIESLQDREVVQ